VAGEVTGSVSAMAGAYPVGPLPPHRGATDRHRGG
jgi:hypothetical protein